MIDLNKTIGQSHKQMREITQGGEKMTTTEKLRKGFEKNSKRKAIGYRNKPTKYYTEHLELIIDKMIPYMRHAYECPKCMYPPEGKCTCGLDDKKKRWGLLK